MVKLKLSGGEVRNGLCGCQPRVSGARGRGRGGLHGLRVWEKLWGVKMSYFALQSVTSAVAVGNGPQARCVSFMVPTVPCERYRPKG